MKPEIRANLTCRLRRRSLGFRAACSAAGYGKSECRRAPAGKRRHACPASCAATQGEYHHTGDRARDYQQGAGNNRQASGYSLGLNFAPGANRIKADVEQICFGTKRKTEPGHGLTRLHGQVELLTDTPENIVLGNAANVAFMGLHKGCDKTPGVSCICHPWRKRGPFFIAGTACSSFSSDCRRADLTKPSPWTPRSLMLRVAPWPPRLSDPKAPKA